MGDGGVMRKPDPLPTFRAGFCAGCQKFVDRLNLIDPAGRYRCDRCAVEASKEREP